MFRPFWMVVMGFLQYRARHDNSRDTMQTLLSQKTPSLVLVAQSGDVMSSQTQSKWSKITRGTIHEDNMCKMVCGYCGELAQRRWSAPCWPQCHRKNGQSFEMCLIIWLRKHHGRLLGEEKRSNLMSESKQAVKDYHKHLQSAPNIIKIIRSRLFNIKIK